jgi:phosphoglycolate phosphatase
VHERQCAPYIVWACGCENSIRGVCSIALLNFDYDGVLADSCERLLQKVKKAQELLGAGRAPTKGDFEQSADLRSENIAKTIGMPEHMYSRFAFTVFKLLKHDSGIDTLFPGIATVITALARRHTITVITANLGDNVKRVMDQNGLGGSISSIFDGAQPGSKSEKIRSALKTFGTDLSDSYMIGDTVGDIRQGKIAQVKTIAVTWGFQPKELLSREAPDYIIDSPEELLDMLM